MTHRTLLKALMVLSTVLAGVALPTRTLAQTSAQSLAPNSAQNAWPAQVIRIIVPYAAGTGMDIVARAVAPRLQARVDQAVLVVNTSGASGNIGAEAIAKAAPDGCTVLMGASTMLIAAQIYKSGPFDPQKDLAPVSLAATGALMLVTHPKTGIKSVNELIAAAKARPGAITYGSPGMGTPNHMAMELFKVRTGTDLRHVPYKVMAGYTHDLLSGELMAGFLPVQIAQGLVATGKLNALAVGSAQRHAHAPQVAVFDELGIKGMDIDLWYGFFVSSKTPSALLMRLNTELGAVLAQAEVRDLLGRAGLDAKASTPGALAQLLGRDAPRWGEVIRRNAVMADKGASPNAD
jgi:tripartite-type tricarboxylate transporter receptor subunit TctC